MLAIRDKHEQVEIHTFFYWQHFYKKDQAEIGEC